MFAEAYRKMNLKDSQLTPVKTSTFGVRPKELPVLDFIELPAMFIEEGAGGEARSVSMMVKWLVVDVSSSYKCYSWSKNPIIDACQVRR